MAQFRTNYQPGGNETERMQQCARGRGDVALTATAGAGSTPANTTSSKFDRSGSSSSHTPWNFNHSFHLGNYIN